MLFHVSKYPKMEKYAKEWAIEKCKKHHKPRSENQKPKPSLAWIEYDKGRYCAFEVKGGKVWIYVDENNDGIPDWNRVYSLVSAGSGVYKFISDPISPRIYGVCVIPGLISWVFEYRTYRKLEKIEANPYGITTLEFDY